MRWATLYVLYGRRAGAELFVEKALEEIQRLAPPDWQLTVLCNAQARKVLNARLPNVPTRYVPWLDTQWKKAFWLEFLSQRTVNKRHFDFIWLPSGGASFPGRWDIPSIVTFLDFGVFLVKNRFDFKRTIYRKYFSTPRSLRRATALTAISKATADDLARLFPGAPPATVIHLGASPLPSVVGTTDPAAVIEDETGLKLSRILFAPARTDYLGKGRDILLRAYADYRQRAPAPLPLLMPGPKGEYHESTMRDIDRLGLRDHAVWPGRVSDACIEAFYKISDMTILPSRIEGFGFPVLEAMARGVPVICSDAGSLPEVAGGAALLFPSGDAGKLRDAMLALASDPVLRAELSRKGRERCRDFSWETTARKYLEAFKSAVAGRV